MNSPNTPMLDEGTQGLSIFQSDRESSIVRLLHGSIMDFCVHNAAKLETCVQTMINMCFCFADNDMLLRQRLVVVCT